MALSVTVNTDATALRTVNGSGSVIYDRLIPIDPAWSVVTYIPDGTGAYARVLNHPTGGGGSFTSEATIFGSNPLSSGGPICSNKLTSTKCGWVRWRNAVGWGLTMFNVSSSGIGTVGSEQTIVPSESFASGLRGCLVPLTSTTALLVYDNGSPGTIRAAHIDHSAGLTITGTADYTTLVASGMTQCVAPIDSTHVLILYWSGTTTLNAAIITDSGGTISLGTATTLLTGTQNNALDNSNLDGNGCHVISAGSSYLACVASGTTTPKLYVWVINVSSGSITSTTADPSNGTYNYDASRFTFTLGGVNYLGIVQGSTVTGEAGGSSVIDHVFKLDTSHQIGTDLGSLSGLAPSRGWYPSFDSSDRLVSFMGQYTDTGTAGGTDAGVRGQEFTLNGLITGGWTVGAIAMSA